MVSAAVDAQILQEHVPAVNWVNVPCRRVEQCEVGYDDLIRMHQFDEVSARVFELILVEFLPPGRPLPVNCSVIT